jgi:hypothetical protein
MNTKIASLVHPILSQRKTLTAFIGTISNIQRNMGYWKEIWRIVTSPKSAMTPKQKSLLELFMYLELVEGVFSEVVHIIAFTLVENGHDIYNPYRMKFAKVYEELYDIPMFVKLQFLEEHEFDTIASSVDRELRNCIAHLRFIVNEDGSIVDRRTGKAVTSLKEKTDRLGCVCAVTLGAVDDSLK